MPYYAANVIGGLIRAHPDWRFTIVSNHSMIPYAGIEDVVGTEIHRIDTKRPLYWRELGVEPPDAMILTSWSNFAFMTLAREARRRRGTFVISMVDNYWRGTPKQLAGILYFRLRLRGLFDRVWVPGARGAHFLRVLGMPPSRVMSSLYTADPNVFYPPSTYEKRREIVFVGQLIPRKGVWEITKALTMRDSDDRIAVRLVGHGPLADGLRQAGAEVVGFQQPHELAKTYRRAGALLMPSRLDHWGVVAHEAACCGCLILATRQCACIDDLVEHGQNGYVMNRCSAKEILKAIDWYQNLSGVALASGRHLSIRKASAFTPSRWREVFEEALREEKLL